ncbi:hypothetical protein [Mycobacterium malmoense]|uniref:hypothetical protein n=1 Tax=Mycobacterium malmoense TaxID=1780 RepID=UPI002100627E|nr:hypothetical protein [Mycobacterium malmoense]
MEDFSRLSTNWYRWAPGLGGGAPTISTDCPDCVIRFSTDDYSVHLRDEGDWWVVDTVNDRGQRRNAAARFSSFNMAEKYLIWDWATTARADLASGSLGADLARQGYAPGVEVSKTESGYEICLNNECAVLSVVNATIFSHLMSKSVEELEGMVTSGL